MLFQEIYSTGPAERADGQVVEQEGENVQFFSYEKDEHVIDEDDIHETKFLLRFLATNTDNSQRYLWVNDTGEVRTDGGYTNIACKPQTLDCMFLESCLFALHNIYTQFQEYLFILESKEQNKPHLFICFLTWYSVYLQCESPWFKSEPGYIKDVIKIVQVMCPLPYLALNISMGKLTM